MNIPHEKFCVLPWVSLEASPIGTVRPCCLAMDEIVDDAGDKIKIANTDFAQIQNSNHMRQLRQEFLDGKQPKTCRRCWQEERAGRTSKRMHTLDRLKHMGISDQWSADAKPLMFLDLKLGNICNLKCRICGSWSSSTFATEELLHIIDKEDRKTSFHYQMLQQGAWPRMSPQFWEQLDNHMDQIRYLEFTGGEPFMIQEHFDLLQRLVDKGHAHRIEIHYNTNGTQLPDAEMIWKHFKHVEIAFSIDDVGPRFEYQRTNAVWDQVVANLQEFKNIKSRSNHITLQVCCTINVFNIYYIDTVARWIAQQGFDFVYWNMLHDAYYFSISTLPQKAKDAITQHLSQCDIPPQYKQEIEHAVNFMNNGASLDGQLLRIKIQDLDAKRNQNLQLIMPELANLINYETQ